MTRQVLVLQKKIDRLYTELDFHEQNFNVHAADEVRDLIMEKESLLDELMESAEVTDLY